jgi:hypothetical protein
VSSPNINLWILRIYHKNKYMFADSRRVVVEGEPPPSAKQAMEQAAIAWRCRDYKIATFKMVEAFAHCKASLQCFHRLILLGDNRIMFNDVVNKFTDTTSVDHHLLVMVMTSAHPETPGRMSRLETMRQVMFGIYSTSKLLYTLQDRELHHFGNPAMEDTRFLSRWKLHHYRAIYFSRLYAFHLAKRDSAKAHTLMVSSGELDQEVVDDYHTYAAYRKGKKYACAVCGCLPKKNLFACSQCKVLSYCGRPCQRSHWKHGDHQRSCQFLAMVAFDV